MSDRQRTRRRLLAGLAVPTVGALAGCGGLLPGSRTPTPEPLPELRGRSVFVDAELSLSVPDVAERTDVPGDAEIVVVPSDTDRSRSAIVHWLARDASVAFVGAGARDTWHEVKQSGAYAAMLGEPRAMAERCAGSGSGESGGGSARTSPDCEPTDLLVAWHLDEISTTYGFTWADTADPSARRIFDGIDTALGDDA